MPVSNQIGTSTVNFPFNHKHPNYLDVACLPFAQQFYSLDNFDTLRYPKQKAANSQETASESGTSTIYKSAFSSQEKKKKLMYLGKKLVTFAHYDRMNRIRILNTEPVYGVDLRNAIKVNLLLAADLHENKRHTYVDRSTKFADNKVNECFSVPTAVFNSFAITQKVGFDETYEPPMCKISDLPTIAKAQEPSDL